jgi:hypothetical protein
MLGCCCFGAYPEDRLPLSVSVAALIIVVIKLAEMILGHGIISGRGVSG